jgi:hypothetical protein
MTRFRWNDWNLQEATKHGCSVEEIEEVVRRETRARRSRRNRNDTIRVEGRGVGGRMIEVMFVLDGKDQVWDDDVLYVIHAMPLTTQRRRST